MRFNGFRGNVPLGDILLEQMFSLPQASAIVMGALAGDRQVDTEYLDTWFELSQE